MKLQSLHLHTVKMPLRSPFTTSFSTQTERKALILEGIFETNNPVNSQPTTVAGWGECVALADPLYSAEYIDGAATMIERYLVPTLTAASNASPHGMTAETVAHHLRHIVGHPMAKSAVEMMVLDAQLRARGQSFAHYLGVTKTRVPSGVSVGIYESIPELIAVVADFVAQGYVRIKLKIKPGWDLAPVQAVRAEFGADLMLQVDANAAYSLVDAPLLRQLDQYNLLLIEQPLGEDDLYQHAQLGQLMRTPMCLDESITSAKIAADALSLNAVDVINIKPGRVGGYLESRRIHDLAQAHGKAVWCGGMLETGLGRAGNAALAGLPGFTLPGDISASDRFYREDITEPLVLRDGHIEIPTGPGMGVEIVRSQLEKFTSATVTLNF